MKKAWLGIGLVALLLASCSFDTSSLDARRCESDADCDQPNEYCGAWGLCERRDGAEVVDQPCDGRCAGTEICCEGVRCVPTEQCCEGLVLCDGEGQGCCGDACVAQERCCGGEESNLEDDPENCGACGNQCAAVEICVTGRCTCPAGLVTCDPSAPCAVNLSEHPAHCGACNVVCGAGGVCQGGSCVCDRYRTYCEGNPGLCGTELLSDDAHCGACGQACPDASGCVAGQCRCGASICGPGQRCCDWGGSPTCTAVDTVQNCGACGRSCYPGERCQGGYCVCGDADPVQTCNAEQRCCDGACVGRDEVCPCGDAVDGCAEGWWCCFASGGQEQCVNIDADAEHCGACGNVCESPLVCRASACRCPDPEWPDLCWSDTGAPVCRSLATDTANCGACGVDCTTHERALAAGTRCEGSLCVYACEENYGHCDPLALGCTTALLSDEEHCGLCDLNCRGPHMIVSEEPPCVDGVCRFTCETQWGDCDADLRNGCEQDLRESMTHCGACGQACVLANATSRCRNAECEIVACDQGFFDCDGVDANGCESTAACTRVSNGLLLLYTFREGTGVTTSDRAGRLSNASLRFGRAEDIWRSASGWAWMSPQGVDVSSRDSDSEKQVIARMENGSTTVNVTNAVRTAESFSLELWLETREASPPSGRLARIMGIQLDNDYFNFLLMQGSSSQFRIWIRTSTSYYNDRAIDSFFTVGTLHHVVVVFRKPPSEGPNVFVYRDGVEVFSYRVNSTLSGWSTNSAHYFSLLNRIGSGNRGWLGKLYLSAVYDRALTPSEVRRNHGAGYALP